MIPKMIKAHQIGYKPYKRELNEDEEEGNESNESVLITEDPVQSTPTQSESMRLGYDSDATVLMTGSPGLTTLSESEVRMLEYNWDGTVKRGEGERVLDTYTSSEEPRLKRKLLDDDLGECTMVSREDEC